MKPRQRLLKHVRADERLVLLTLTADLSSSYFKGGAYYVLDVEIATADAQSDLDQVVNSLGPHVHYTKTPGRSKRDGFQRVKYSIEIRRSAERPVRPIGRKPD